MERVLIIGPCGAGKSTLAAKLGAELGLPVLHMDKLNWRPGWTESSKSEIAERLETAMAGDRWLIDGNYGGTLAPRLARADTVVLLDYPIWLCLWRVLKRYVMWRGRSRPDMAEGCPERIDLAFLWYVTCWHTGPGPRSEVKLRAFSGQLIRLRGPRATQAWLGAIRRRNI